MRMLISQICFPDKVNHRTAEAAECPWRVALVTIMQYAECRPVEGLSDRQAADAVRSRIDWKYILSLELTDVGFDSGMPPSSVLSEFRSRLIKGGADEMLLDTLLEKCREKNWVKAKGRQRTDSTGRHSCYVLGWIRAVNHLVCVAETLRAALNSLAIVAPDWLARNSQAEWLKRYERRVEDSRLPVGREKRDKYTLQVGTDGYQLLTALYEGEAPEWLVRIPAIDTLRQVWLQQYYIQEGTVSWRGEKEGIPAAANFISSPAWRPLMILKHTMPVSILPLGRLPRNRV